MNKEENDSVSKETQYYIAPNRQQQGPFDYLTIISFISRGEVKPDTLVWKAELPFIICCNAACGQCGVASGSSNNDNSDKTYFLVRPIAETHSPALKHEALMSKGLMGKRPSTTKLSKDEFKALKEYIEQHFNKDK